MKGRAVAIAAALAGLLAACGGPDGSPVRDTPDTTREDWSVEEDRSVEDAREEPAPRGRIPMSDRMADMHRRMMGSGSLEDAPATLAVPASAAGCPETDQNLVERGREVFAGTGSCFSCHGGDAAGGTLGPDLTDGEWLSIDGSYESIAEVVRIGVSRPRQFPAPMPPMGGASLSQDQVCAVSAYIYSLSHS